MWDNEDLLENEMEIPPRMLANLIMWMRNKGINDTDIVDCLQYICSDEEK